MRYTGMIKCNHSIALVFFVSQLRFRCVSSPAYPQVARDYVAHLLHTLLPLTTWCSLPILVFTCEQLEQKQTMQ